MDLLTWIRIASSFCILTHLVASQTVAVGDVPACARTCLSNSTAYATDCAQIDVKCLCNSANYVSALSCCLATTCSTSEQQTAIQFNIQECAAVNSTAPSFVGCSPFSLTTGGGVVTTSTQSTGGTQPVKSSASTVTGDPVTEGVITSSANLMTASFTGHSLLTGSCSVPFFAQASKSTGTVVEFPEVGCGPNRQNCCPFDIEQNAVITQCPQDYYTTAGGCCPLGFQVYYTAIGSATPCYSQLSVNLLPATTPTISDLTLITDHIFARRYALNVAGQHKGLGIGATVGITIGALAGVIILAVGFWCLRRHKIEEKKTSARNRTTFPPEEPALHQIAEVQSPQELASPGMAIPQPAATGRRSWPFEGQLASTPVYDVTKNRPMSLRAATPQELPGCTFVKEHHPAFSESQTDVSSHSLPKTSLTSESARSPVISPTSLLRVGTPPVRSVSPLNSL